ncbi:DUF3828 domain-containing protein [Pseudescherichia vulneris]
MYKILIALLLTPAIASAADDFDTATKQAIEFNKWYLQQISLDKYPLTDSHNIDKYVSSSTLKKLRAAEGNDNEYYDADYFTRSQYIGDDWLQNVTVVASDYEPVCFNVYVSYGKNKKHTISDCMVKENGTWKVDRVTDLDIHSNSPQ